MSRANTYYVWEMGIRDRRKPTRQVNTHPLELEKAKQLARIGATHGKHDRSVTTSPRSRKFEVVAVYEAGSGQNITQAFKANKLRPAGTRRQPLRMPAMEYGDPDVPRPPSLPMGLRERVERTERGERFDMDTGEPLLDPEKPGVEEARAEHAERRRLEQERQARLASRPRVGELKKWPEDEEPVASQAAEE